MKRTFVCMLAMVFSSVAAISPLSADERGEIKNKMEQLRLEARELASRGEEEAASDRMKMVRELNARLRTLTQKQAEPQRHERMEQERREREEMLHHMARRLEHLRVAAQHLKEAEMHDMAHELGRHAEEMEHKLRAEKERFAAELERVERPEVIHAKEKMPPIVVQEHQQLREEHQRLIEEHDAWGRKVKEELVRHSEVINDIRAEQEKMRREFKELRQLIERLHQDKLIERVNKDKERG
ncbi:MAG: hypothetical protein MUF23_07630 [Pirellula sp.]|jgi:hypothetical protein|nr:hypothetical protein [Pirellula sp.]